MRKKKLKYNLILNFPFNRFNFVIKIWQFKLVRHVCEAKNKTSKCIDEIKLFMMMAAVIFRKNTDSIDDYKPLVSITT